MTISDAAKLFGSRYYQESFLSLVSSYNGSNASGRESIMEIILNFFYLPHEAETEKRYKKNLQLLREYPFFLGDFPEDFSHLTDFFFPISSSVYVFYDCVSQAFSQPYNRQDSPQHRYFFDHLEQPLSVEDELSAYWLKFLSDNVRSSEDYGADNHIYLRYNSSKQLSRLLLSCDLTDLLATRKFVFLVGGEAGQRYPLDFLSEYGIDYSALSPTPIRPEEVKRLCYWYKHAHSGTLFSRDVFNCSAYMQMLYGYDFYAYTQIGGESLDAEVMERIFSDSDRRYPLDEIDAFLKRPDVNIKGIDAQAIVDWARTTWPDRREYTVRELFTLCFLYPYAQKKVNPRIIPIFIFDPHVWLSSVHNKLVQSFPYYTVLTCMREPARMLASSFLRGLWGWDEFQTKYMLASDYTHTQFLDSSMLPYYYGYRFEDLKTKPEATLRGICRVLNVPYDPNMLNSDVEYLRSGVKISDDDKEEMHKPVSGFSKTALNRDISSIFSDFDLLRLKIFFAPILDHYGYPSFSFEEYPLTEQQYRELMSFPFRVEKYADRLDEFPPTATLHKWIQDILQTHPTVFISPKLIPLEEPQ